MSEVGNYRSFFCGILSCLSLICDNLLFSARFGTYSKLDQVRDFTWLLDHKDLVIVCHKYFLFWITEQATLKLFCLICLSTLLLACRVKNGAQLTFLSECRSPWRIAISSCRLGVWKTMPKVLVSFKRAGEISESLVSPPELQCLSWWLTESVRLDSLSSDYIGCRWC